MKYIIVSHKDGIEATINSYFTSLDIMEAENPSEIDTIIFAKLANIIDGSLELKEQYLNEVGVDWEYPSEFFKSTPTKETDMKNTKTLTEKQAALMSKCIDENGNFQTIIVEVFTDESVMLLGLCETTPPMMKSMSEYKSEFHIGSITEYGADMISKHWRSTKTTNTESSLEAETWGLVGVIQRLTGELMAQDIRIEDLTRSRNAIKTRHKDLSKENRTMRARLDRYENLSKKASTYIKLISRPTASMATQEPEACRSDESLENAYVRGQKVHPYEDNYDSMISS